MSNLDLMFAVEKFCDDKGIAVSETPISALLDALLTTDDDE